MNFIDENSIDCPMDLVSGRQESWMEEIQFEQIKDARMEKTK